MTVVHECFIQLACNIFDVWKSHNSVALVGKELCLVAAELFDPYAYDRAGQYIAQYGAEFVCKSSTQNGHLNSMGLSL